MFEWQTQNPNQPDEQSILVIGYLEGRITAVPDGPLSFQTQILDRRNNLVIVTGFFNEVAAARAWVEAELVARQKGIRPLF